MRKGAVRVGDAEKVDRQGEKAVQVGFELTRQVALLAQPLSRQAQLEFVHHLGRQTGEDALLRSGERCARFRVDDAE